jgi:hypothetical protein
MIQAIGLDIQKAQKLLKNLANNNAEVYFAVTHLTNAQQKIATYNPAAKSLLSIVVYSLIRSVLAFTAGVQIGIQHGRSLVESQHSNGLGVGK